MLVGSAVGLIVMMAIWFALGADQGGALIGGVLLNMAVCGAMFSYIAQGISFILLRKNNPGMKRPYVSPMGYLGAILTIVISIVTLGYQIQDPLFFKGVVWVFIWFAIGIAYFAFVGRTSWFCRPRRNSLYPRGRRPIDALRHVTRMTDGRATPGHFRFTSQFFG